MPKRPCPFQSISKARLSVRPRGMRRLPLAGEGGIYGPVTGGVTANRAPCFGPDRVVPTSSMATACRAAVFEHPENLEQPLVDCGLHSAFTAWCADPVRVSELAHLSLLRGNLTRITLSSERARAAEESNCGQLGGAAAAHQRDGEDEQTDYFNSAIRSHAGSSGGLGSCGSGD